MDVSTNKESESVQKNNSLEGNKGETPQKDNGLECKIYKGNKGKYQIFEYVDRGRIGTVWKAKRTSSINENGEIVPIKNEDQDTVAIKILHSNDFDLSDSVHWERFEIEIVHGQGFNHPNLVKVLDGVVHDNEPFLVMEYIEGESLSDTIPNRRLNSAEDKIEVSLGIIKGLREIHRLGFVHRDLKPDNIVITNEENRKAVICDYGLLKKIEGEPIELIEHNVGANTYISLHQRRNPSKADKGDDIYSLCLCLFEIFTGEKWHTGCVQRLDHHRDKLKNVINKIINFDSCLDQLDTNFQEMRLKYGKEQKRMINDQKKLIKNIPENYSLDDIEKLVKAQKPKNCWIKPFIIPMLIIAGFIIFQIFFHKYTLTIETIPEDAQVSIIINLEMKYTPGMKLKPGPYRIRIVSEGFKTVDKVITVDRDVEESVQLTKPCLTIKTKPEDAQVRIINSEMEYKPGMELEPGRYHVEVSHRKFKQVYTFEQEIKDTDVIKEIELERTNKYGMKFVYIPPGEFEMGSPDDENGHGRDETLHNVQFRKYFYMQTTEVTQKQWEQIMGNNPSEYKSCGENCPVDSVSWNEVEKFIKKLNDTEKTADKYDLPTEAQWEYACRAGTKTPFAFGECLSQEQANYDGTREQLTDCNEIIYRGRTRNPRSVGILSPNNFGLHDMHGNVWEWVKDSYYRYISPQEQEHDPPPCLGEGRKLVRGGSWQDGAKKCRSANRYAPGSTRSDQQGNDFSNSMTGFRLIMKPQS